MKTIKYDSSRPLMRLEKGDKAIISVSRFPFANSKDKERYKDVPEGKYNAICVDYLYLECADYPILSGRYNYWRGDKWGCSEGIYADEANQQN